MNVKVSVEIIKLLINEFSRQNEFKIARKYFLEQITGLKTIILNSSNNLSMKVILPLDSFDVKNFIDNNFNKFLSFLSQNFNAQNLYKLQEYYKKNITEERRLNYKKIYIAAIIQSRLDHSI